MIVRDSIRLFGDILATIKLATSFGADDPIETTIHRNSQLLYYNFGITKHSNVIWVG